MRGAALLARKLIARRATRVIKEVYRGGRSADLADAQRAHTRNEGIMGIVGVEAAADERG